MGCGFDTTLYSDFEDTFATAIFWRLVKRMNGVVERVSCYDCRLLTSYSVSHEALFSNLARTAHRDAHLHVRFNGRPAIALGMYIATYRSRCRRLCIFARAGATWMRPHASDSPQLRCSPSDTPSHAVTSQVEHTSSSVCKCMPLSDMDRC